MYEYWLKNTLVECTKSGIFLNIVPLVVHTFLPLVFQCLDPIVQKIHEQEDMSYGLFSPSSYIKTEIM